MDFDRLKHSYAFGKKMIQIGRELGLKETELNNLFLLGLNHDIGYEFTENGVNHNKIGGNILKNNGYKYWKEVYYHGDISDEYNSLYLTILNQADMQIDKYGTYVGYDKRLENIKNRYGEESDIYLKCVNLVDRVREIKYEQIYFNNNNF